MQQFSLGVCKLSVMSQEYFQNTDQDVGPHRVFARPLADGFAPFGSLQHHLVTVWMGLI